MTDKERITEILKAYTKKHNIMASSVILEEYADELVKQGVVMPIRCKDCKHLMFSDMYGECSQAHMGIVRPDDFCSYGERKDEE